MSKFKLEFSLKQHTPLIHFQSEQSGATLRATELKPKLDRFLLEHVFQNDFERYKKFLIGYKEPKKPKDKEMKEKDFEGKKALDYKIKISPSEKIEIFDIAPIYNHYNHKHKRKEKRPLGFPIFFASIDKDWKEKSKKIKFSLTDNIDVSIKTFNTNLKNIIEENIVLFFFLHNFGMRQSKGFGSFTVSDGNIDDDILNSFYYFDINISSLKQLEYHAPNRKKPLTFHQDLKKDFLDPITETYENNFLLFKAMDLFYKTLRSGINFNSFYFKSLMFLYAKEKLKVQWDKKTFKSSFLSKNYIDEQKNKHDKSGCKSILTYSTNEKYLLRDCLGLSTIQEYNYSRDYKYSEKFTIRHPNTDIKKKDKFKNKDIEPNELVRMQSPLFMKPIKINNKYRVFILEKEYPKDVFEKSMTILKVQNKKVKKKIDNLKLYPNFNLKEYLDFAFSTDIEAHLQKCGTSDKFLESQLLISLYSNLNEQAKKKVSK